MIIAFCGETGTHERVIASPMNEHEKEGFLRIYEMRSKPILSGKLRRGSLRYGEAVELADVLGYDII